ncbi:CRISPR-associated protein Cas4 [Betaproteobacteria bacterium]|nr:CRISPR-associated protein Cas4 [Betaproteobacteria bacterium]GHU45517.1 CRISPR-associated protein Cas4 [Betaproteobacteria bacterium]
MKPEPIPLSALQHWAYCPRQYALIHLEQVFEENLYTLRGQALHKRVDDPGFEVRSGLRTERALPLFCDRMGLVGKADIVEFLLDGTPYPVEYKHGSRHKRADIASCDDVQLAAQALCLEEMFARPVPEGALYYASSKRRRTVIVDAALRQQVVDISTQIRIAQAQPCLPPPQTDESRCHGCSLLELCQPKTVRLKAEYRAYIAHLFTTAD